MRSLKDLKASHSSHSLLKKEELFKFRVNEKAIFRKEKNKQMSESHIELQKRLNNIAATEAAVCKHNKES